MKTRRQEAILEIIAGNEIKTQEELLFALKERGLNTTQATLSRDIRELKLTKVPLADGTTKYVSITSTPQNMTEKYERIFRDGFLSMETAQNILVIKTVSGMAMAVAAAIDSMDFPEIAGSIAGDDTVMCAIRSVPDAVTVMNRLKKII